MIKFFSALLLIFSFLNAYEIIDKENVFSVKINDKDFKTLYFNLKDEINFQSYVIVHELDLGKSTASVADALEKKAVVKNGVNILICKSSFTLEMHEENIENMTFCPMVISVYEDETSRFISFRKYQPLKKGDKIAFVINQRLKSLILKSLD